MNNKHKTEYDICDIYIDVIYIDVIYIDVIYIDVMYIVVWINQQLHIILAVNSRVGFEEANVLKLFTHPTLNRFC